MPIPANPVDGEVHAFANGKEITFTALPLASKGTQVSHDSLLITAGVNTDTNWQYVSSQMQFNPDGTKFYMGASNASNLSIGTWDLSTPYDLSTQTFNSMSPSRNIVYMDSAVGMLFTPDGSKLLQFVNLNNSNPSGSRCRCYVFDLTTPFDLSTISNSPSDVDLGTVAGLYGSVHGAAWNGDGSKIFLAAHTSHMKEVTLEVAYDMTSAFNVSTVVNHSPVTLNADITGFWGVGFSTNGSIGYIMESNGQTNELHVFDLSTPYSFSTATLNSSVNIDEGTEFNTSYPKKFTMAGDTPLLRASVPSIGEQFIYVNMGSGNVGKWHVTKAAYTGETGSVVTYALVADLPESPYPTGELAYVTETKKLYFAGSNEWFVINDSEAPNAPLPPTNLVANGDFSTSDLTGWTSQYGTFSIVNNALNITRDLGSGYSSYYTLTGLEVGTDYTISFNLSPSGPGRADGIRVSEVSSVQQGGITLDNANWPGPTAMSGTFTATQTTMYLITVVDINGETIIIDDLSVEPA